MSLVGCHQAYAHYMRSPDGFTLYNLCCQGQELMFKILKGFCKAKGTGKEDMISSLADFVDLYNVSSVGANMIDFNVILKQCESEALLIFDPNYTPNSEANLEDAMPPLMKKFVSALESINFGDPIPDIVDKVLSCKNKQQHLRLRASLTAADNYVVASQQEMDQEANDLLGQMV